MAETAQSLGVTTSSVISHMNAPLGQAVGNSLEVRGGQHFVCSRAGPAPNFQHTLALIEHTKLSAPILTRNVCAPTLTL